MSEPAIRASDADRDHAAEQLRGHCAAGRLDIYEYEDRVAAAYAARTWAELRDVLADLPADEAPAHEPAAAGVDPCLLICLLIACPPAGLIYWLIALRARGRRGPLSGGPGAHVRATGRPSTIT